MRILQVVSEAYPLVKTGGLGDVAPALSGALRQRGHDVRLLLPAYPGVAARAHADPTRAIALGDPLGLGPARLLPARMPDDTPLWLLDCPALFDRPGGPYLDESGIDHVDNHLRFGLLSRAAAMLGTFGAAIGWQPDIVHAHDWQAGLVPAYLHLFGAKRPGVVFTVHNLEFAGAFAPTALPALGLPYSMYSIDGLELYGQAAALKAGLYYADRLTTVSQTYAEEIQTVAYGCGLHGLLQTRAPLLDGVVNGIDEHTWDPAADGALPVRYDVDRIDGKSRVGFDLRARFAVEPGGIVLGMVSRLTAQKGVDLLLDAWALLDAYDLRLVVLGTGDPELEQDLRALADLQPGRVGFVRGYDEALSHLVIAGSDALLVPSRFEPCGLTQMYAMRYGTVPIVRRTGGLADTVVDVDDDPAHGTGVAFDETTGPDLASAIVRALALFADPPRLATVRRRGMLAPFGWSRAAAKYEAIFEAALRH